MPDGRLDTFLSFTGVRHASWLLSALGWEIETTDRFISCAGKRGVFIQNGCNGLNLLGLYAGFIVAYPGPWDKRLPFLAGGLFALYLAIVARIAFFAVFNASYPQYWGTAHEYSSYVFFYPIVLSFWYLWTLISEEKHLFFSGENYSSA
ncbi:MAG: hypothetical protein QGG04_04590 [Candidatus Marinimicrobia bacterium]|nr:hypothetical protein [Candidatus Neomarinimicrobiota bacterium]